VLLALVVHMAAGSVESEKPDFVTFNFRTIFAKIYASASRRVTMHSAIVCTITTSVSRPIASSMRRVRVDENIKILT
jgi:hypothetical protein